jgi:ankyrin repeat protein
MPQIAGFDFGAYSAKECFCRFRNTSDRDAAQEPAFGGWTTSSNPSWPDFAPMSGDGNGPNCEEDVCGCYVVADSVSALHCVNNGGSNSLPMLLSAVLDALEMDLFEDSAGNMSVVQIRFMSVSTRHVAAVFLNAASEAGFADALVNELTVNHEVPENVVERVYLCHAKSVYSNSGHSDSERDAGAFEAEFDTEVPLENQTSKLGLGSQCYLVRGRDTHNASVSISGRQSRAIGWEGDDQANVTAVVVLTGKNSANKIDGVTVSVQYKNRLYTGETSAYSKGGVENEGGPSCCEKTLPVLGGFFVACSLLYLVVNVATKRRRIDEQATKAYENPPLESGGSSPGYDGGCSSGCDSTAPDLSLITSFKLDSRGMHAVHYAAITGRPSQIKQLVDNIAASCSVGGSRDCEDGTVPVATPLLTESNPVYAMAARSYDRGLDDASLTSTKDQTSFSPTMRLSETFFTAHSFQDTKVFSDSMMYEMLPAVSTDPTTVPASLHMASTPKMFATRNQQSLSSGAPFVATASPPSALAVLPTEMVVTSAARTCKATTRDLEVDPLDCLFPEMDVGLVGVFSAADMAASLGAREALVNLSDSRGNTPLAWAVRFSQTSAARYLLAQGADVSRRNNTEHSPIQLVALLGGPTATLEVLLQSGADPNERDLDGTTPLIHAASNGRMEHARLLLAADAHIAAFCDHGICPLIAATIGGHYGMVSLLSLHPCANPAHKDSSGRTALHWAGALGNTRAVIPLLRKNSDLILSETEMGETPPFTAVRGDHGPALQAMFSVASLKERVETLTMHTALGQTLFEVAAEAAAMSCLAVLTPMMDALVEDQNMLNPLATAGTLSFGSATLAPGSPYGNSSASSPGTSDSGIGSTPSQFAVHTKVAKRKRLVGAGGGLQYARAINSGGAASTANTETNGPSNSGLSDSGFGSCLDGSSGTGEAPKQTQEAARARRRNYMRTKREEEAQLETRASGQVATLLEQGRALSEVKARLLQEAAQLRHDLETGGMFDMDRI